MIKAMKQALEALEKIVKWYGVRDKNDVMMPPLNQNPEIKESMDAITVLRQAIEQAEKQEQVEPVAWLYPEGLEALQRGKCWTAYGTKQDDDCNIPVYLNAAVAPKVEPAKAECGGFDSHPAAQRKWIKLTDEEVVNINDKHYNIAYRDFAADIAIARAIEDKLRNKNT